MPARQSGTRPRQRAGGCRIRLQGLHEMSMRTILDRADNGAYRVGRDGPKTASTGVSTAAARCIGPVSPVMNRASRSSTAASNTRSTSAGSSMRGTSLGHAARTASTTALSCRRSDEHNRDIARARKRGAHFREAKRVPFLDAAAGGGLNAHEGSALFGRGDELGRSAARLFRNVQSGREVDLVPAVPRLARRRAPRAPSRSRRYERADRGQSRR